MELVFGAKWQIPTEYGWQPRYGIQMPLAVYCKAGFKKIDRRYPAPIQIVTLGVQQ